MRSVVRRRAYGQLSIFLALWVGCAAVARVFDSSPRRYLTPTEGNLFGAINKIQCRTKGGLYIQTTSPLVVYSQIAVTVAHTFRNSLTNGEELRPQDCAYVVYDDKDRIIDRVNIIAIKSRWADDRFFDNHGRDFAIVKLERPAFTYGKPLAIDPNPSNPDTPILLIGFHADIDGGNRRVLSEGVIVDKKRSDDEFYPSISIHSASGFSESSGAPLIAKKTGLIVGLHIGDLHAPDQETSRTFNARTNYNRAIIFDKQFLEDVSALME